MAQMLAGRVAVVTGAASGIGRATAIELSSAGARVLLVDLDEERMTAVADEIRAAGGVAVSHLADVTYPEQVRRLFARAESTLGPLDILCNNAGMLTGGEDFETTDDQRWEQTLSVNLRGVILGCKYAIPHLRQHGGGTIVNTASMAGFVGFDADPVYAASKGGVTMLTRSLRRLEAEAGIRVTCVCPSFVDTPMTRDALEATRRTIAAHPLLEAVEVARVIVFLASDAATGLGGRAVRVVAGEAPMLMANPQPDRPLFGDG
jgi:NAD(P)-dependent dehydrogenase (short-subunit alcohol dehydrogenase family)